MRTPGKASMSAHTGIEHSRIINLWNHDFPICLKIKSLKTYWEDEMKGQDKKYLAWCLADSKGSIDDP